MVYLSFDIEEFDLPLEHGIEISLSEQIYRSREGLLRILDLLERERVVATFFSTVTFAEHNRDLIEIIIERGHELASHGCFHSTFEESHYAISRDSLMEISGSEVKGFRAARMMEVSLEALLKAGYSYDSSINPTFIPGRYNNFSALRRAHFNGGVIEIPASVSPIIRFPLFWLAFHLLPLCIYQQLANWAISKDGYLNIYFHPWEFSNSLKEPKYGVPSYISACSGDKMVVKFEKFIRNLKKRGMEFGRLGDIEV